MEALRSPAVESPLAFARMGLRLVPLRGKSPLVKNWPGLHLGDEDIRKWSARQVNWGAIRGEIIVVDSDSAHAEKKIAELGIVSSVEVRTGRGGLHRYFLAPDGAEIRCRNGLQGVPGFDLKGWHGLVVLPGSIHPDTGKCYTFVPGKELRTLAELPVFDLRWLREVKRDQPLADPKQRGSYVANGIKNVRAYIRGIRSVQGERGSNACFRVASLLFDHGFSQEEALSELEAWNAECAFPPWSTRELVKKVTDVWRRKLGCVTNGRLS